MNESHLPESAVIYIKNAVDPETSQLTRNTKATITWLSNQPQFSNHVKKLIFEQLESRERKVLIKALAIISFVMRTGLPSFREASKEQKSSFKSLSRNVNQEIARHASECLRLIEDDEFYQEAVSQAQPTRDWISHANSSNSKSNGEFLIMKIPKEISNASSSSVLRPEESDIDLTTKSRGSFINISHLSNDTNNKHIMRKTHRTSMDSRVSTHSSPNIDMILSPIKKLPSMSKDICPKPRLSPLRKNNDKQYRRSDSSLINENETSLFDGFL